MNKGIAIICLSVLAALQSPASVWYASPTAAAIGDGSLGNPWPLQVALTNTAAVTAGDTLYLRGGTYVGGFHSTLGTDKNSPVIVRAYPSERVIITDNPGTSVLQTAMTTNSTAAQVSNSQNWYASMTVSIGAEVCQVDTLGAASNAAGIWRLNRAWAGTTNKSHSIGTRAIPFAQPIIAHTGTNVWFWDLDVTSTYSTNRVSTYSFYPGDGIDLHGLANKVIDCRIYNTGHPGIGFWNQGAGGEINGCLIWGTGQYDYTAGFNGDVRGAAIYAQNSTNGLAKIRNIISFDNFTTAGKVFGETGPVQNFIFDGDIAIGNGADAFEMFSGSTSASNTSMINCLMTGSPALHYVSFSNTLEIFTNNVIVNGSFTTGDYSNSTYAYNTVFMTPNSTGAGSCPIQYTTTNLGKAQLSSITWDFNNYYLGSNSSSYQWAFTTANGRTFNSLGGGNLKFNNDGTNGWTNQSGFDVHSTFSTNWPPSYLNIKVQPLDYDSNQFHICVISTSGQSGAILNLTNYGFASGDQYELRDAQNYFTVIQSGTNTNGFITLPLNLTNFAGLAGGVTNFTPQHSNVRNPGLFNAFALLRIPAPPPPPDTNQPPTDAAPNAPLPPTNLHVIDQ